MVNRVAASLAEPDTSSCLAALNRIAATVGLAEIRLDLMRSYDLERLREESPCPLIITCRPLREGGRFCASEAERLGVLAQAIELGFAYADVEWDSVDELRKTIAGQRPTGTRLIVSRHWPDRMPESLWDHYVELRAKADVIKLVGLARSVLETLPIIDLLSKATSPVIALAMGEAGRLTRILAPCFESCLLSYGALSSAEATAPGQLSLDEMLQLYKLNQVGPQTVIRLRLCDKPETVDDVARKNAKARAGDNLYVGLLASGCEAASLASDLSRISSRFIITADQTAS